VGQHRVVLLGWEEEALQAGVAQGQLVVGDEVVLQEWREAVVDLQ